jgi:hypothetical protein
MRCCAVVILTMGAALLATLSWADSPRLRGIGVDETLAGPALLAEALNEALMRAEGLPLYVRIQLAPGELDVSTATPRQPDGRGFRYAGEHVHEWLRPRLRVSARIGP